MSDEKVTSSETSVPKHTACEHRQFVIVSICHGRRCADMSELSLEEVIERGVSLCC